MSEIIKILQRKDITLTRNSVTKLCTYNITAPPIYVVISDTLKTHTQNSYLTIHFCNLIK